MALNNCCFVESSFYFSANCNAKEKNKDIDGLWGFCPTDIVYTTGSISDCEDFNITSISAGTSTATPLIYFDAQCNYPDYVFDATLDIETCEVTKSHTIADLQINDNNSVFTYCNICSLFCAEIALIMHRKGYELNVGGMGYLVTGIEGGNYVTNLKYDSSVGCFQIGITGDADKPLRVGDTWAETNLPILTAA